MANSPKRSHFFADFHAEGTLSSKTLNPLLMGKPSMLGSVAIAIESSRFNNGSSTEWFYNTGPETGLFVIESLKQVFTKIVTPHEHHARIDTSETVYGYGTFIHGNPTGYTAEDLAYGMSHDAHINSVEYKAAMFTIENFDFHEPILPVTVQKLNAIPR